MDEYSKLWYECSKNLGKLNTEMGEKCCDTKFLKLSFRGVLRSIKRATTPLKKAI